MCVSGALETDAKLSSCGSTQLIQVDGEGRGAHGHSACGKHPREALQVLFPSCGFVGLEDLRVSGAPGHRIGSTSRCLSVEEEPLNMELLLLEAPVLF